MASPEQAIVTWAEQQAHRPAGKPKPDYSRLAPSEISLLAKLHRDGFTQTEIAQRLGCNQRTVGRWIERLTDTTDEAKAYLRGQALRMARHVVKKGRAQDHVATLKGLQVLEDERVSGLTVLVGAGGTVNIGQPPGGPLEAETVEALSPASLPAEGESPQNL